MPADSEINVHSPHTARAEATAGVRITNMTPSQHLQGNGALGYNPTDNGTTTLAHPVPPPCPALLTLCDSRTILGAIQQFYIENNLDLHKTVMFTSDGASVMLGKRNGVAALLRTQVPHLTLQQCVAHQEDE